MRYALNAWCDKKYLAQADEIIVTYKEKERILDYPEQYPNAAVTIQCWRSKQDYFIDWKWLNAMKEQFPKGFSVGVLSYSDLTYAQEWDIPAYMLKHISSYVELNLAKYYNACFVYLDQPLFSSLNQIKKFDIPVRWTPNIVDSSPGYLITMDRLIHGTWIRPEDIDKYNIIDGCTVEFPTTNGHEAEQAFYRVYHNNKEWNMDLGFLLLDFKGKNIANYLIDPELIEIRLNCGQKCEQVPNGNGCHVCDRLYTLANREKLESYLKKIKKSDKKENSETSADSETQNDQSQT